MLEAFVMLIAFVIVNGGLLIYIDRHDGRTERLVVKLIDSLPETNPEVPGETTGGDEEARALEHAERATQHLARKRAEVFEEATLNGMARLRATYNERGVPVPDDEELRSEVVMMLRESGAL